MTCIKNKIILVQYQIDLIGSKKTDLLYVAITAIEIVKKERLKSLAYSLNFKLHLNKMNTFLKKYIWTRGAMSQLEIFT